MRFRIILYLGVYTLHVTRALGDLFLRFPSSIIALFPSFRFFVRSIIRLAVISGGVTHFLTYL